MLPVSAQWPLVGRAAELRGLTRVLTAVRSGECAGVAVRGDAGVGKSRLAGEAASQARAAGIPVCLVAGTATSQDIPLGAFANWTGSLGGDPLELVGEVADAVTTGTGGRVVVIVDDAHLLDPLSAIVVQQLVAHSAAQVVATVRSGVAVPEPITALWESGRLELLDLLPLPRRDSDALLADVLGADTSRSCAQRMWELTQGNVLYLRHLVDQERREGRLAAGDGSWDWGDAPHVSASLAGLIESHVGSVPRPVLDVVDLVAIAEPVELSMLVALTDPAVVAEAQSRGLITVDNGDVGDSVRIGHPLYGEVRRSRAGPVRLRRLRGRIATALASVSEPDVDTVVRAGVNWLESDLPPDPVVLMDAARAAFSRLDLPLTQRLAAKPNEQGSIDAALLTGYALNLMSRAREAEAVFAALDYDALDDDSWCAATTVRAANRLWPMGDPVGSWKLVEDARAQNPTAASRRHTLRTIRSIQFASSGRPDAAIEEVRDVDWEGLPPVAGMVASWALVIALGDSGAPEQVSQVAAAGYRLAARSVESTYPGIGLADHHVTALIHAGCVGETREVAEQTVRRCSGMPGIASTVAAAVSAMAALAGGSLAAARDQMAGANDVFAQLGEPSTLCYRFGIITTEIAGRLGDYPSARKAHATMTRLRHPAFDYLEPDRLLATAWVAASRGTTTAAVDTAIAAAEHARTTGQRAREVMALQTATQFGAKHCAPRLAELSLFTGGPRVAAASTFAAALAEGDTEKLYAVSDRFAEMGDLVAAADAVAHATLAHRSRGQRGSALTAADKAEHLAADSGGAMTPALRMALHPLPVRPRERELLALVAEGLTNKEIAEVLGTSVRTVEGHLYRAAARTGISNRTELAKLLEHNVLH